MQLIDTGATSLINREADSNDDESAASLVVGIECTDANGNIVEKVHFTLGGKSIFTQKDDLSTLNNGAYLNDVVLDFYFKW